MLKKLIYPLALSVIASVCTLLGYSYASHKSELAEAQIIGVLDVYKAHMLKQLKQTDDWIGGGAMNQLDLDIELIKASESNSLDSIEQIRKLLWLKISATIEDLEKVCEVKTYPGSKERCTKQIDEAHFYLKKYAHYKGQI